MGKRHIIEGMHLLSLRLSSRFSLVQLILKCCIRQQVMKVLLTSFVFVQFHPPLTKGISQGWVSPLKK